MKNIAAKKKERFHSFHITAPISFIADFSKVYGEGQPFMTEIGDAVCRGVLCIKRKNMKKISG